MKNYYCYHILVLGVKSKLIEIPDYTKKVALGINKPRGRKRKAIAGHNFDLLTLLNKTKKVYKMH